MRIEAVFVGGPRQVSWQGSQVQTSIFKAPVEGRVMARTLNIDGDRQSDLAVHGGEFKAIYSYALENYRWWSEKLGRPLEPANFGENLTIRDFPESEICLGDTFRTGEAEIEAIQPRLPCYKLGIRFGDPQMVRLFTESRRWGIYFRVLKEGMLGAGDPVVPLARDPERLPVYDIARVYFSDRDDTATMRRLADHGRLAPSWRDYFRKKLAGG
jgi:MOSC domain-containing protein YiiM